MDENTFQMWEVAVAIMLKYPENRKVRIYILSKHDREIGAVAWREKERDLGTNYWHDVANAALSE